MVKLIEIKVPDIGGSKDVPVIAVLEGAEDVVTVATVVAQASTGQADSVCQLVVLGAGPGGYTAAFRAADLGLDVVLIERYPKLGGVCLNVGCIPSKTLLHAAEVIEEARHAASYGVNFGEARIDLDKLRAHKDKVVGTMNAGLASMAKQRKVRTVTGSARFVSANELQVETERGKQLLRFEQCIIAAGSQPVKLPGFPWDEFSDNGGYAHLISAAAQWLTYLDGKRDWERW